MSGESRHACLHTSPHICASLQKLRANSCICACHAPPPGPLAGSGETDCIVNRYSSRACKLGTKGCDERHGDTALDIVRKMSDAIRRDTAVVTLASGASLAVAPGESATVRMPLEEWTGRMADEICGRVPAPPEPVAREWQPHVYEPTIAELLASARRQGRVEGLREAIEAINKRRLFTVADCCGVIRARLAEAEKS